MARQAGHPNIIYCVGNIVSRSCHAASTHIFLLVENNMSVGSRHPSVEKLARVAFKTYFMELGGGLAGTGYRIYIQIILYSDPAGSGGAQHQIKRGQFLLLQRAMADLLALDSLFLGHRAWIQSLVKQ